MRAVVVLAAAVWAAAGLALSGVAASRPPLVLTEAETGSRVVVMRPRRVFIRLDHRWRWSSPRTDGRSVVLDRVKYETDPGYDEWLVRLTAPGKSSVTSAGTPNCTNCTRKPRRFQVTIVVR